MALPGAVRHPVCPGPPAGAGVSNGCGGAPAPGLTGSGYVVLTGDRELPVSRRHTRELKDRLIRATKADWSRS